MRILHVFDHSLPLQSGYVTRSLAILRSQRAHGWKTTHLTSPRHAHYAGDGEKKETIDGWTFHRTSGVSRAYPLVREVTEMRATGKRLAALVRAERPDIIHAHSPALNAIPAIVVGRRFGVPIVYEVRALWEDAAVDHGRTREGSPRYRLTRWLDSRTMHRADWMVAICESLRQEIVSRGIPADRVSVVPNAVNSQFLAAQAPADSELCRSLGLNHATVLGFIGSFYSYEGLDLLLDAVKLLRQRRGDIILLLVGGGPEEERLREMVKSQDSAQYVKFIGRVKLDEVMRYYPLVDLFVFPRRKMRLTDLVTPLKPLEAMAQQKPVLASDVGGHRELIRHGETGLLFPSDDPTALASAIEDALSDRDRLNRMVENGRRFVDEQRNWTTVCDRYSVIYEAVLAQRKRAPWGTGPITPNR